MPPSGRLAAGRSRIRTAFLVILFSIAALASLRTAFAPRIDSVRRVEAHLGEDVRFVTAPDGSAEVCLAVPFAGDRVGGAAAALATAPRIALLNDGRYGLRVVPTPGVGSALLAPGSATAASALAALNERIERRAAAAAGRLASLGDGGVVFVDSRSRRIPLALSILPDLRHVHGLSVLVDALRRTLERPSPAIEPPALAPVGPPAEAGSPDSRAEAIASAARERARQWAADAAAAGEGRTELAAFADGMGAFALEIAPGGPETRRILAAAARDALSRFVQHAGPVSVSPPVRMANLLLLGAIGGALVAAARGRIAAGLARPALGGAVFALFAVVVLESNGILPTLSVDPLGRWVRAPEIAAIVFGFIGGGVLDGRIVARPAVPAAATTEGGR